jgi:hypothetical protein
MSRLTEIQKAIEELAFPRKKRSFANGSMDMTLLWNVNGPRSPKSGYAKSNREKWLLLMARRVLKEMRQLGEAVGSTVSFQIHPDARNSFREAVLFYGRAAEKFVKCGRHHHRGNCS